MNLKLTFLAVLFLCSCQEYQEVSLASSELPSYIIKTTIVASEIDSISLEYPKAISSIGESKIAGNYLYINEPNKGIHVLDNRFADKPSPLMFINLPLCKSFAIQDSILIANNGTQLVHIKLKAQDVVSNGRFTVLQVANDKNYFEVLNKEENLFSYANYPEQQNVYFECPEEDLIVTEWELQTSGPNQQCFR